MRVRVSAVLAVSETKELKTRHGVVGYAKRELFRPFWKPPPVRAAPLSAPFPRELSPLVE